MRVFLLSWAWRCQCTLKSVYAKFQPSSFQTDGGDRGDRRCEGWTDARDTKLYCFHKKFITLARGGDAFFNVSKLHDNLIYLSWGNPQVRDNL